MSAPRPLGAYADVGRALARRRAERGATLEFAARALHVPHALLANLEAGALGEFDAPIYYVGHLRRYAAWLELDAAALVRMLPVHPGGDPLAPEDPGSEIPWSADPRTRLGIWVGLLLVGAIFATLWFVQGTGTRVHPLHALQKIVSPRSSGPSRVRMIPSPLSHHPARVLARTREPMLRLRFALTRASWIAVTRGSHTVYAGLVKMGGHLRLVAKPPVKVVLGDARGLAFYVDGRLQPLAPWTGPDHVAVLHLESRARAQKP